MSRGFPKGLPLVLGVGSVILLLASSEAKPAPKATPEPPEPPEPPTPPEPTSPPPKLPSHEQPPPMFGEYVALGELATVERESRILQGVRSGLSEPIQWVPIETSDGEHEATIWVSSDALKLPVAATLPDGSPWSGLSRVNVTHPSASLIGVWLGAYTPTSKISDLAWTHAQRTIRPQTQTPDDFMMNTSRMVRHSLAIDQRAGPPGELLRTVGKIYVASPKNDATRDTIFGWHDEGGGYRSPGGLPVMQPISNAHPSTYRDYSHFPTFVRRSMLVDGEPMDVADVARDPVLHPLVSDEGPIPTMIHPSLEQ